MKKLVLFIIPFLAIGCKTIEKVVEVPVETVRTEYKDVYHFDSIYLKENVYIYQRGDTVFRDSTYIKYVEKRIHDTLITHDTIPQIINTETTKTVEKKVPQWWPVWLSLGIVLLYYIITKTTFIEKLKIFIKYLIKLFK